MKSYIQDLCGDENPIVIDCAILQCMLQEAIFERLVAVQGRKPATADYSGTTTGSPTVTTDGTDTILTYTSSGTYTA